MRESAGVEQGQRREGVGRVLAATREEFFAKLDQLKAREPDFESLVQPSGSNLSAISGQLDSATALLEYYPAEDSLYVFVVTASELRVHQVRARRVDLEKAVGDYARLLRDPQSDLGQLEQASHALYGLLLGDVLPQLEGVRNLRVVPAGALWHVPFQELRDEAGHPLNESYQVSLLTSADVLRTISRRDSKGGLGQALLLGAPDEEDLEGASAELRRLHEMLIPSTILTGAQGTAKALRAQASRTDLLHVASHSGLGREPGQSYISLADGPFRAEQIYGLSLKPGSLVVLSSCRSAVGESNPGRELTSLASAFNIAGASTVIASHWEVDDQVTTDLMVHFYEHLLQGKTRGEALRLARQELAKIHPHPYYWAAFSLFGSPD